MPDDLRLSLTFCDHPKTIKLSRTLGPGAPLCLIRLWCIAAQEFQDGRLRGKDSDDIEIIARWDGEPGLFVQALLDQKWLDLKRGTYFLHNWNHRQPWLMGARDRSLTASLKAKRVWKKRLDRELAETEKESGVKTSCNLHAPTPSPSPSPSHTQTQTRTRSLYKNNPYTPEFENDVWDPWRIHPAHLIGAGPGTKAKAWESYQKRTPDPETREQVRRGIQTYLDDAQAMKILTMHLSTWLNQEAFVDWSERVPRTNPNEVNLHDQLVRVQDHFEKEEAKL